MKSKADRRATFQAGMAKRIEAITADVEAKRSVTLTGARGWERGSTLISFGSSNPDVVDDALLASLYSKSELVFACVRELSTSAIEAPLQVGKRNADGEFEAIEDHDALAMFYEDPRYSYAEHIGQDITRKYLTGLGFSMLELFMVGGVAMKTPVPSQRVAFKTHGPDILGFEIDVDQQKPMKLDANEACYSRILDPLTYQGYMAPLQAAYREIITDSERSSLTAQVMKNRKLPGAFLESEAMTTKTTRQQIVDSFEGQSSPGHTVALPPGVKFKPGVDVKDIDFSVLATMSETRICMVFGVHPVIIAAHAGIEASTFNNYGEARKSFYSETELPLWTDQAAGYTRGIFRAQGETELEFRFDLSEIAELQEDRVEMGALGVSLYDSKLATKNESRTLAGLEPVDDGDDFKEDAPVVPFGAPGGDDDDEAGAAAGGAEDNEQGSSGGKSMASEYDGAFGHKLACTCASCSSAKAQAAIGSFPESGPLEVALKEFFAEQEESVLKDVKVGDETIDLSVWDIPLAKSIGPILWDIYETYGQRAMNRVISETQASAGKNAPHSVPRTPQGTPAGTPPIGSFDLVRKESLELLEAQIQNFATSVNLTTAKNLDAAIQRAIAAAGATGEIPDLATAIQGVFLNASDARARVIAITESSRAQHDGQILAGAKTGLVVGYKTIVSSDACPICEWKDAEGQGTGVAVYQSQTMDGALGGIGDYTSDAPPFHPNCRCTQIEVLTGETMPEVEVPLPGWTNLPRPVPKGKP